MIVKNKKDKKDKKKKDKKKKDKKSKRSKRDSSLDEIHKSSRESKSVPPMVEEDKDIHASQESKMSIIDRKKDLT